MIVDITEQSKNPDAFMSQMLGTGARLAENKDRVLCEDQRFDKKITMGELLEGLPECSRIRSQTAIMLENTRHFIDNMSETTKLLNIGDFEKYAFPMVRAVFPNLAAHNLASVQPMLGPISMIFFMKFLYGRSKGSAIQGQDLIENPVESYSSEEIDSEDVGDGDGSTATFTPTLSYTPVKPGTLKLSATASAAALEVTDDGNGALVGDVGVGTNTINYVTGAINVTFSSAPDSNTDITAQYEYDFEASDTVPDIDLSITGSPVVARTRKMRTRWSLESAQDLRNLHGLEAEVEQVAACANELKFEIDRDVINSMNSIATNSVTAFSRTAPANLSFTEHKLEFVDKLLEASTKIFSSTQRAEGTWIVCGTEVSRLIESLPGFVKSPRPKGTRAVYKAGVLNGDWEIWKDPNFAASNYLMGYQGDSMWEVGYVFAPYILGYTTATIALDDFQGRKGMMSRYGKKSVDGRFMCTGSVSA